MQSGETTSYYTPKVESKLPWVGTTIFSVMTEKALKHQALNLSQGFPDFPTDPELIRCVHEAMQAGHNQYAPMHGVAALREIIAEKTEADYGATYDPEREITITSGATEALFAAISAIVHPNNEVIVIDPCYDSYVPAIDLNGGKAIYVPLQFPDYRIDWHVVKRLVNRDTRAILINSPHNPCSKTLGEADMRALADLVRNNNNIFVISDEVYEYIIFDKRQHQSVCRYPELAARSFKIGSFGKSLHVTGWKAGYCLAPAALTAEFRKIHQYLTFSTPTPIQIGIAEYLKQFPDTFQKLRTFYQQKRDLFTQLMEGSSFRKLEAEGTYFQLYCYEGIADEPDVDFATRLIEQHGVATVPVSVLRRQNIDDRVLRFCFAKDSATLEEAARRLCKI